MCASSKRPNGRRFASDVFLEFGAADRFERCEVMTWVLDCPLQGARALRQRRSEPWDEEAMEQIEDEADGPEQSIQRKSLLARCAVLAQLSGASKRLELFLFQDNTAANRAEIVGRTQHRENPLFYAASG